MELMFSYSFINFKNKLTNKNFYKINISRMKLRLAKLQEFDSKTLKIKFAKKLQEDWEEIDKVLYQ